MVLLCCIALVTQAIGAMHTEMLRCASRYMFSTLLSLWNRKLVGEGHGVFGKGAFPGTPSWQVAASQLRQQACMQAQAAEASHVSLHVIAIMLDHDGDLTWHPHACKFESAELVSSTVVLHHQMYCITPEHTVSLCRTTHACTTYMMSDSTRPSSSDHMDV